MEPDDDFAMQNTCQKCAAEGGGCCTGEGSGIFVTLHDVLRINKALGIPLDDVACFEKVSEKHLQGIRETDTFFYKYVKGGRVLQLQRNNGTCKFLKDVEGCTIFNHRPIICRLFPFSFVVDSNGVRIVIPKEAKQKCEECSILYDNYYRSKGATYKAMNTSKEKLMVIVQQHLQDLKEYAKYLPDLEAGLSLSEIAEKYGYS